tara:strand:+ start:811 stop:1857 length:1047 start_codon:yes stop_codon:yes gene_type:complete
MAYTTINKSTDYFNTVTYTGNGGTQNITGVGFQPDWVWIKHRNGTSNHNLFDAVRGVTKYLESSSTAPDQTGADRLTAFGTDGFTTGSNGGTNGNNDTYVSWHWKAGTGQGSSNTDGSINTTYTSVNTTAGFSISKFTGTGSAATVGHGLGAVPKMYMVKNISTNSLQWRVYHTSLGATKHLALDASQAVGTASSIFNDTEPTSTVFSIGTDNGSNKSGDSHVAYCFAEKKGYSKFGSFTGNNNADGPFVYTGFKPAFVIIKKTDSTGYWVIQDNKRTSTSGTNPNDKWIYPNASDAEYDASSYPMDLLSNGFKIRHNGNYQNTANNYIYLAFGQSLVGSNNVPCTAR